MSHANTAVRMWQLTKTNMVRSKMYMARFERTAHRTPPHSPQIAVAAIVMIESR